MLGSRMTGRRTHLRWRIATLQLLLLCGINGLLLWLLLLLLVLRLLLRLLLLLLCLAGSRRYLHL